MYRCTDCNRKFEYPRIIFEGHGFDHPPFERVKSCPHCGSGDFEEIEEYFCRFCGSKLKAKGSYCGASCERAGKKYFEMEKRNADLFKNSPVASAVREIAEYNRAHGTGYSYGQYFALKEAGKI